MRVTRALWMWSSREVARAPCPRHANTPTNLQNAAAPWRVTRELRVGWARALTRGCVRAPPPHVAPPVSVGGEPPGATLQVVAAHLVRVQGAGQREAHRHQLLHRLVRHLVRVRLRARATRLGLGLGFGS